MRTAEATKNDLPRVKLETTEGSLVIELFENEAPQAVGNFVNLVEKKYYDGLIFHRVLPGFMAQGGCPDGRGSGGPGYNIYCECQNDGYRKHFSGTLSMAHAGKDTGGSQFFLTFLPTPHLDGRHTAFGRVIEGMDVLSKLKRVNPQQPSGTAPSKIKQATVIRKRQHPYVPTKVK
ncbi:MAG: peptidylprolyl isomerase [Planctomycetota bacterium]|nr:peptidylprolyl isomerase [Planctomycetota bacterium]